MGLGVLVMWLVAGSALAGGFVFVPLGVFEVGFEDGVVRIRNPGPEVLVLDGIALVDPNGWSVPADLPGMVPPGEEVAIPLTGPASGGPRAILVRTPSGVGQIHPQGMPSLVDYETIHWMDRRRRKRVVAAARSASEAAGSFALEPGATDGRVELGLRIAPDGRALAWVQSTSFRSGAVEQCVLDAVRSPLVRYRYRSDLPDFPLGASFL